MDILWIILLIVGCAIIFSIFLSIATFSNEKFLQEYEKYNNMFSSNDINILDFIHSLNHNHFNGQLKIKQVEQDTDNFYAPKAKVIGLSKKTLTSNSLASFAIVAHEVGHALQDREGSKLKTLNFLRRFGSLIGFLFLPTILTAIILLFFGEIYFSIAIILFCSAGAIFILAVLIKAVTISIEKDASKKGLELLKNILSPKEVSECKKLLNSARLTYWGDLFRLLLSWTFLTKKTIMFRK